MASVVQVRESGDIVTAAESKMLQEKRYFSSRIHPKFGLKWAEMKRFSTPVHEAPVTGR